MNEAQNINILQKYKLKLGYGNYRNSLECHYILASSKCVIFGAEVTGFFCVDTKQLTGTYRG